MSNPIYRAIISSDWSECLSPNGPFDPMAYTYPDLVPDLTRVFREYTGNKISLVQASKAITGLLPENMTVEQMDAYLDNKFLTYSGVPDLIRQCAERRILFMINTTGMQGYFQRVFAKGLLPRVPVVASNPLIRFPDAADRSVHLLEVNEIEDKPINTARVIREWNLPPDKVAVMGDSGGDGPHFVWAAAQGIFTIGSMTKTSLKEYCRSKGVSINSFFGLSYEPGEPRNVEEEMKVDFMGLIDILERAFDN